MNPRQACQRILVTVLSPIGDTLFATPAIRLLRRAYPDAYIAALAFPTNQGIIQGNPDLDEIFTHPTIEWWPGPAYHINLLRRLRGLRFDLGIDLCTAFWITRLIIGPRRRMILPFAPYWWILPTTQASDPPTHAVRRYLEALEPLGLRDPDPVLHLDLSQSERGFAAEFLEANGLTAAKPLIAIHPGGAGFRGKKRWHADGFGAIGQALASRYGARIILLGGDSDQSIAQRVAGQIGKAAVNGSGAITLKETAAVIERCDIFIGNDSSPLHMAAAVGTPVVGIYGPSNPANFHPIGVDHAIVQAHGACAPCFHFVGNVPLWKRSLCRSCYALEQLATEEVLAAAETVLARVSTGPTLR